MNNYFLKKIKELKSNISQSSLLQYSNVLNNLYPNVKDDADLEKSLSMENLKKTISFIESNYTSSSTKGFKYNAIIALLKGLYNSKDDRYIYVSDKRDECNQNYLKNAGKLDSKQSLRMVSTEEYKQMLDEWKPNINILMNQTKVSKNEFMEIQSYFLAFIYFYHAIRIDISPMLIIFKKLLPESDSINYLHVFNKKYSFVFNAYKTAKTYGQNITALSNKSFTVELAEYIKFLKVYNNRTEGLRLFSNKSNSDYMDTNNISTLYKNIFKARLNKSFNFTLNRKRFVSESKDVQDYVKSKEKVENLATDMMNSVNVQQKIYNVNSKK